jgi:hypothetical protein
LVHVYPLLNDLVYNNQLFNSESNVLQITHTHTHTYIYINKLKHAHKYCESINICSVRYFRDQYETTSNVKT